MVGGLGNDSPMEVNWEVGPWWTGPRDGRKDRSKGLKLLGMVLPILEMKGISSSFIDPFVQEVYESRS